MLCRMMYVVFSMQYVVHVMCTACGLQNKLAFINVCRIIYVACSVLFVVCTACRLQNKLVFINSV